jgi:hypothetical protein
MLSRMNCGIHHWGVAAARAVRGCLWLLAAAMVTSCATIGPSGWPLPGAVALDPQAGRGSLITLMVRMENGEPLPFILDTGTAITCLDQSLEPALGPMVGPATALHFGVRHDARLYRAPQFFLGRTPLRLTGTNIATFDFRKTSPDGVLRFVGILGMDVLRNYCFQLDFDKQRLRFLSSPRQAPKRWGKSFPLTTVLDGCPAVAENFLGRTNPVSILDTGFNYDGWLTPDEFRQWTAQPPRWDYGEDSHRYGFLGGDRYAALNLKDIDARSLPAENSHMKVNGIGLRFLARHLVTLDFPNRMMYLRRVRDGALLAPGVEAEGKAAGDSAFEFAWELKKKGRLPGWSRADRLAGDAYRFNVTFLGNPDSELEPIAPDQRSQEAVVTLYNMRKRGEPSLYYYELRREGRTGFWRLVRAWQTDPQGGNLREFPLR